MALSGSLRKRRRPVYVALIDLDHFKDFNDRHGHPAGDALLRRAAIAWRGALRTADVLARYGGEEFAVMLAGCSAQSALEILDRVRLATIGEQSVSIGLAVWDGRESADQLVCRADAALYAAKHAGARPHRAGDVAQVSSAITASGSSTETISSRSRRGTAPTRAGAGGSIESATSGPEAPLTSQRPRQPWTPMLIAFGTWRAARIDAAGISALKAHPMRTRTLSASSSRCAWLGTMPTTARSGRRRPKRIGMRVWLVSASCQTAARSCVPTQTSACIPRRASCREDGVDHGYQSKEAAVLIALVVLLLVLAVVGGIAVHPLLFLLAVLAVLALFSGRFGAGRRGPGRRGTAI